VTAIWRGAVKAKKLERKPKESVNFYVWRDIIYTFDLASTYNIIIEYDDDNNVIQLYPEPEA
jgi:hypothetical protein